MSNGPRLPRVRTVMEDLWYRVRGPDDRVRVWEMTCLHRGVCRAFWAFFLRL